MKRYICLLLAMLFLLAGCQVEEPKPTEPVDTEPVLVPGTMESGLLMADPGNYYRSIADGNGDFLEIESGYYYMSSSLLYYADKNNLEKWLLVCNDPACDHNVPTCSAGRAFNNFFGWDGRIYFINSLDLYPHLYDLDPNALAIGLMSMAYDGQDVQLEHVSDLAIAAKSRYGGAFSAAMFEDSYIIYTDTFEPDGTYTPRLIRIDSATGEGTVLFEQNETREYTFGRLVQNGNSWRGINGDPVLVTDYNNIDYWNWFYWFHEGKPIAVDGENLPTWGSYLSGSTLRLYRKNDGYYDRDMLTGEEIKLADTQLADASARIIQPNCILEWNSQEMRLFDGKRWRPITIPEEVLNSMEDYSLWPMALCSDRILFRLSRRDVPDYGPRLYSVMLTDGELNMAYTGKMSLRSY